MPVKVTKTKKGYKVSTPSGVHAKGTTKEKAEAQARLLRGIEHSPKFAQEVKARAKAEARVKKAIKG